VGKIVELYPKEEYEIIHVCKKCNYKYWVIKEEKDDEYACYCAKCGAVGWKQDKEKVENG